ncbi:MAG: ABC transporter permease [Actinobacteria bacterium]|nr:ABC transporter permease [Actinomycetota bacterium]
MTGTLFLPALFRAMLAHRLRLVLTGLAIALGVAFMAGSFIFSATLTRSLDSLFTQASMGTDVQVRHVSPGGSTITGSPAQPLAASVLTAVRRVPGVAAADGQITGQAALLGRDGKPLPGSFGVALSWPADAPFQAAFTRRTGQPPAGPGQVMIDRASARRGRYAAGQTIGIAIAGHAVPFTITGITGYGSADSLAGGSMAIFSLPVAQQLFGKAGEYDQIVVKAAPGVPASQLRDRIASVLPAGDEAVTAASASASAARQINSDLGILTDFFLGFAGIALFVAAFVIWNTFSILVGQRTRELALARALGAGAGQVFRSVLAEAAILAAAASLAGAALGLGMARALAALLAVFGFALPVSGLVLPAAGLAVAIGTGIAMTVAASLPPAFRATRIAPVQAMRDPAPEPARFGARRLTAGLAVTAVGIAALLTGILGGHGPVLLAAAGAAGCFAGVTILAPLTVRPLAWLAGAPLARLPGRAGLLARGNTMRNPKRTAATAAALMIGLAVIAAISVLVSSARATIGQQIAAASRTDYYVQAANGTAGLDPALVRAIARQPGIRAVTEVRQANATVAGAANTTVDGIDPAAIGQFTSLGVTAGDLAALAAPGTIMVTFDAAAGHGWKTGGAIRVQFGAYGAYQLRIVGLYANTGPLSSYLVSTATLAADSGVRTDSVDLVRAPASARTAIRAALAGYPGAQLLDQAGYIASQTAVLNSLLTLVTAMLILAIVIALLGVVNTLALSISERTREIGLLRAIGMQRGQLRQMIAAESVIISVIGALLGIILGLGLGAALAAALTRSPQATVTIPAGQLIIYILATAAAGVLASIGPARRATRLDMLTAIAAD